MERNYIHCYFHRQPVLHDLSFIQVILFLKMLHFSVFFLFFLFFSFFFFQVLQEDNVRIMTCLCQFASKQHFQSLPFEPNGAISTQKWFPLIVSFWKTHLLECFDPAQKLFEVSKLECLAVRAGWQRLPLALCYDDVLKTGIACAIGWRMEEPSCI